jgi:hypothetical protein
MSKAYYEKHDENGNDLFPDKNCCKNCKNKNKCAYMCKYSNNCNHNPKNCNYCIGYIPIQIQIQISLCTTCIHENVCQYSNGTMITCKDFIKDCFLEIDFEKIKTNSKKDISVGWG